jgi:hypothetical protein
MSEPFESRLEKKLEAKLGPAVAKWETLAGSTRKHTFTDGYLRALSCIAIAAVGIWFPIPLRVICGWRYPLGADAAPVLLLAIPLTIIYAFRATDKLCCAYEDSDAADKRKHLPWIAGTVLICWAPTIVYLIIMIGGLISAYVR